MSVPAQSLLQTFETFASRFDELFVRSEPRYHFRAYLRGLLASVSRKNCWQLAESVGLAGPQQLQRLLNKDDWEADALCGGLREIVSETLDGEVLIGIIDESCVVKRGEHSVGVKRQYCGRLGKVENCQVGVYLGYVSPDERGLLDRELYLPSDWCLDMARRTVAQVPPDVEFKTKPQLALQMLDRVWQEGLALDWISADTTYGNSPTFRNHIHTQQRYYVVAIAKSTPLQVPHQAAPQTAEQIAARIPTSHWEAWAIEEGEKGEIWYEWARMRVTAPNDEVGEQWLLIRRPPGRMAVADFYLSNAPSQTALLILAQVASARHAIEEILEDAKGELGLADYEGRSWKSWYRHMTLVIAALTWLTLLRLPDREKNAPATVDALESG